MSRKAVVRVSNGFVENVIEHDDVLSASWPVPAGHILIASDVAGPGDTWDGSNFNRAPPQPPAPPTPEQVEYAAAAPAARVALIAKRLGLVP